MMKHRFAIAALLVAAAIPGIASAQDSGLSVRLGVTRLIADTQSDAFPVGSPLNLNEPANAVQVGNKTLPELDVYYTFSPNIVAELVLSYPQTHTVTLQVPALGQTISLGTLKELPPTLLAQWHFLPKQMFDPYVGVGINFTWVQPVHINQNPILNGAGVQLDTSKFSVGAAAEAGLNFNVDKSWYVDANVKYINPLQVDLDANGNKISTVKLNPLLYSLGVGYHF